MVICELQNVNRNVIRIWDDLKRRDVITVEFQTEVREQKLPEQNNQGSSSFSISGARREAASRPDRGRAGEADQGVHLHLLPAAAPRVRHVRQPQGHLLPLPLLHQRPARLPRPGHRHSSGENRCPLECQLINIIISDPLKKPIKHPS